MSDLTKQLRIKAGMMKMGERIAWGSDTALMEQAADLIEQLQQERDELAATVERLRGRFEWLMAIVELDCEDCSKCEEALKATPQQNLNAIKLNALLDFRHDCGSMNGYNAVDVWDKMDEYIKREFG